MSDHPLLRHKARLDVLVVKLDRLEEIGQELKCTEVHQLCSFAYEDTLALRDINTELALLLASKSERIERLVHALVVAGIEVPR